MGKWGWGDVSGTAGENKGENSNVFGAVGFPIGWVPRVTRWLNPLLDNSSVLIWLDYVTNLGLGPKPLRQVRRREW